MGYYTPIFGDALVKRDADLGPPPRISSIEEIESVLPGAKRLAEAGVYGDIDHARGTVSIMTDQLVSGGTPPDRARAIATAAARRNDGEAVEYRDRSGKWLV